MRIRLREKRLFIASGLLLFITTSVLAAQPGGNCERVNEPASPGFDFTKDISRWGTQELFNLDQDSYTASRISINQLPIFDPGNPKENNALYRWVNRIHLDTRTEVIRDQLLFDVSDVITEDVLVETERILRDRPYVQDARLRILEDCGDALEIEVVTKEVWTLSPEISFASHGGDETANIGVHDTNFLGSGREISVLWEKDVERNSYEVTYKDPNLNGSRIELEGGAADKSDGHRYFGHAGLPFYSLDSRYSWDVAYESIDEVLSQYSLAHRVTQVGHENRLFEVSGGFSGGREKGKFVKRFSSGMRVEKHRYLPGPDLPAPSVFPDDVSLTYPFVRFEVVEDDYATAYNISQIYRTEDLHVGKLFLSTLGYDTGSNGNVIFKGLYADTLLFRPKHLLQFRADWDGRWNTDDHQWLDTIVHMNLDFHRGQTENRTLYMGLEATKTWGLTPARQITLGGSTGLRGFDSYLLNGDASVKFTVEERLFTNHHLLQLLRVGFAAFADAGRVYGDPDPLADGLFGDVGVGLRLAPSKSDKGQVIHIDLAWPVDSRVPGHRSMQFVMEARQSF